MNDRIETENVYYQPIFNRMAGNFAVFCTDQSYTEVIICNSNREYQANVSQSGALETC